jgi:hypothetical protein
MPTPDFAKARRQLRRARIQDALGLERSAQVRKHRDILIESLVVAAASPVHNFGDLPEEAVDSLVSVAVTPVEEDPLDFLSVELMTIEALAADGQFARLAQMAPPLGRTSEQLQTRRPVLAAASVGLARYIAQDVIGARSAVEEVLRDSIVEPGSRSAPFTDYLLASTLRSVIDRGAEGARLERAVELASMKGDGLAYTFLRALSAFEAAANGARMERVLPRYDRAFASEALREYMQTRGRLVLFPAQISAVEAGVTTRHRSVVALPTSSGKTLLAELRVASLLAQDPHARVIYVAPYRLLARQVETSFSAGLSVLGASVQDLGSRFDTTDAAHGDVSTTPTVAVMTPERLDSLLRLRGGRDASAALANELFDSCRLIIFDELQLIGRRGRGPRMELLLTRLMAVLPDVGFLGLSAASHGADSVARWLTGTDAISGARRPTGTLEIAWATSGELVQRVGPLRTSVAQLPRTGQAVNDAASLILQLDALYRPVLAVCVTRPITESLARRLASTGAGSSSAWWDNLDTDDKALINSVVEEVRLVLGEQHPLATYLLQGIAVHHAGVPTVLLRRLEELAHRRLLRIVCATTTVAEGADLPFKAVVVPHLNFPGRSRRLERDLYLNLIGRAGRANVAIEGMAFLIESDAPTLRDHVRRSLWADTQADRVRSVLESLPANRISDVDDWEYFFDVQSQVMGWLGDGQSYVEEQASALTGLTFGAFDGNRADRQAIERVFSTALGDLEARGFALAASPYRLTDAGDKARLTGLSAPSVTRLDQYLGSLGEDPLFIADDDSHVLSEDAARAVALLTLQSFETLRESLWLRRLSSAEAQQFQVLRRIATGERDWPSADDLAADVSIISAWIRGQSYMDLALIPPRAPSSRSLFGGDNLEKLTSDATEYIGQAVYPALMTWSAAIVVNSDALGAIPTFMREAIELGVPSDSAAVLVRRGQLTRGGAVAVSERYGHSWVSCLAAFQDGATLPTELALLDGSRLRDFLDRLSRASHRPQ